jgi:hypothetical protein
MSWNPEPLTLHWPITTSAGQTLTALELRPFDVAEHRAALHRAGEDDDDRFEELAILATGQPREVIEALKRPDYISLSQRLSEYVNLPAAFFLGKSPEDPDDLELLRPIKTFGRDVERLQLQVPTMGATKAMTKLKDAAERSIFISAHCTGIAATDITKLCVPDWTQLQGRLADFLNQPAAYFQKTTST